MDTVDPRSPATRAVFAIADIKAVVDAFDRGDLNLFMALDAIAAAVEAYQDAATSGREAA